MSSNSTDLSLCMIHSTFVMLVDLSVEIRTSLVTVHSWKLCASSKKYQIVPYSTIYIYIFSYRNSRIFSSPNVTRFLRLWLCYCYPLSSLASQVEIRRYRIDRRVRESELSNFAERSRIFDRCSNSHILY